MVDPKKPRRDGIGALLDLSIDADETPEQAEKELRAMGVDVDGFLARARERRVKHEEDERTAWLPAARAGMSKTSHISASKYRGMDRKQLVADYQRRSQKDAQAYFHKLDDIKDDDLRTLLADLDELDDTEEDPT